MRDIGSLQDMYLHNHVEILKAGGIDFASYHYQMFVLLVKFLGSMLLDSSFYVLGIFLTASWLMS